MSFVGRSAEIDELITLLSGLARLVTRTGAGGIGKTASPFEVAARLPGWVPDSGVWLVELASPTDRVLVRQAIAMALWVHGQPGSSPQWKR